MCLASVSLIVMMAMISSDSIFDVNGAASPEGFEYSVDGSGYVTITGYTGTNEVVIPDTIDGRSVKYIGGSAFENKTSITSITIPNSVTMIHGSAFEGCTALTKVVIGNNVSSLGDYAFEGCTSLMKIFLPSEVKALGSGIFMDCSSLQTIKFMGNAPANVGNDWVLGTHMNLKVYYFDGAIGFSPTWHGVTAVKQSLFETTEYGGGLRINGYNGPGGIVEIPGTIGGLAAKYISVDAFSGNEDLTGIIIPDSVISIENTAFFLCPQLESVHIGNGVTTIGNSAFSLCGALSSVTLGSEVGHISSEAFSLCPNLTSINIPDSVTYIGDGTFKGCTSLAHVSMGSGVTSLSNELFLDCHDLTNIIIPDNVTSIGNKTFKNCTSLTSINIPDKVTSIGADAFKGCASLTDSIFGSKVSSISNYVFEGCEDLTTMRFKGNAPSVGTDWANTGSTLTVYYIYGKTGFDVSPWTGMTLVVVTPPGAPADLGAIAGIGSAALTWTAPADDGGDGITGYEIWFGTSSESSSWALFSNVDALTETVTGLNNGTGYHFGVRAVNFVGPSAFSSTTAATPSAPGIPVLTAVAGDTKVALTWTEPGNGGIAITNYKVWYRTADTEWTLFGDVSTLTATVTGLTNDTEYEFRVAAENAVGVGDVSDEVASTPRSNILALLSDPLVLAIAGGLLVLIIIGVAVVLRRK